MNNTNESPRYLANVIGTDADPYEVVRVVSAQCVVVRRMRAELATDWRPEMVAGGFCGNCTNNGSQRWDIVSDPDAETVRVRFGKRGWRNVRLGQFVATETPVARRDFNF